MVGGHKRESDEKWAHDRAERTGFSGPPCGPPPKARARVEQKKHYLVIAAPLCEPRAERLQASAPDRFEFLPSVWDKFPDSGTDKIELGGFTPVNVIKGSHVLFLADFNSNDAILSQLNALITLCESLIESLTLVLPYYPHGTKERRDREGEVATASTVARLLSSLPSVGRPTRVMIYDVHALQIQFYFHGNALASLHTTVPVLMRELRADVGIGHRASASDGGTLMATPRITAVAFPDDGACKRFGALFAMEGFPLITCGKVRDGDRRIVRIMEGSCTEHHVLIVDDLVRSGGTLHECGKVLLQSGAVAVSAFVAHAAFPRGAAEKFARGGVFDIFHRFYTTDSNPIVTNSLPKDDVFRVLDLVPQLMEDLE